ncbi:MAG: aspartate-semialdehyde dehydrogenase [Bacteroidota bacterium]
MKLAVIGATGLVGQTILDVLAARQFPFQTLLPVASEKSTGASLHWAGQPHTVLRLEAALAAQPNLAIFATDKTISEAWVPQFVAAGTTVIDHSTAWRMHPDHKLIVPEVNGHLLQPTDKIIANPNCSTIQLVMALAPLHQRYGLERLVVATYQAVTGSGKPGVAQLMAERQGQTPPVRAYPHPIDLNVIPHIDEFLDSGYTKEEMKVVNETQKILNDPAIRLSVTAVRVPVLGGHSLAVNVTLSKDFDLADVSQLLQETPGIVVQNNMSERQYPMPHYAQHRDEVFVGRLRKDPSQPRTLDLWIVADNLRKGAATNAVQIAEQVYPLLTQG